MSRDAPSFRVWGRLRSGFESLQWKLAFALLVLLFTGVGLSTQWLLLRAERDTVQQAQHALLQDTVRSATFVELRLQDSQRLLAAVSADWRGRVDSSTESKEALRAFLLSQPALRSQFDGIFVADRSGQLLLLWDAKGLREVQGQINDRAYFKEVVATGGPAISGLLQGKVTPQPLVVLAHPMRKGSEVVAVIGGSMMMMKRDVIAALADDADAATGERNQIVVTDSEGWIMGHANPAMVGRQLSGELHWQRAAKDWQAAGSPIESSGVELHGLRQDGADQLVVVAAVPSSGWLVWKARDTRDVMAPLRTGHREAMLGSWVISAAVGLLGLAWVAHELRPLRRLRLRAASLFDSSKAVHADWPGSRGEIGELEQVLRHVGAEQAQLAAFNAQMMERLQSVMAAAPVGLCFTRDGRFELVGDEMSRMLGYEPQALVGQPARVIYASNEDYAALGPRVGAAFAAGGRFDQQLLFLRADRSTFDGRLQGMPVSPGRPEAGTIWSLTDVTEEVRQRASLEWTATHDALTGLTNRQAFGSQLQRVFDRRTAERPAALLLLDLDHFKPINDRFGHAAGDAMLRAVAAALQAQTRSHDMTVRLGGDEFVVLLEGCPLDAAMKVAENIRSAIAGIRLNWDGAALSVGSSIGVAGLDPVHASPSDWLAAADQACYSAKGAGRDRIKCAGSPQMIRLVHRQDEAARG